MPYDEYGNWYDDTFSAEEGFAQGVPPSDANYGDLSGLAPDNYDVLQTLLGGMRQPDPWATYDQGMPEDWGGNWDALSTLQSGSQTSDPWDGYAGLNGPESGGWGAGGTTPTQNKSVWDYLGQGAKAVGTAMFGDGTAKGGSSSTGQAAGSSAKSAAEGRALEAKIMNDLMATQVARGNMQTNQAIATQGTLPQARAKSSITGDYLSSGLSPTITSSNPKVNIPQLTGTIQPSMFSQNTKTLGSEMSRSALAQQLAGNGFTPVNDPAYPQAGFMENFDKGTSSASRIWDIIAQMEAEAAKNGNQ